MRVCFLGLDNLPALAEEYGHLRVGGEQVQQTLLAKALHGRGHTVTMIVMDYGQVDGASYHGIGTLKTFQEDDGLPIMRFIYPRWTKVWSAMKTADADIYYVSCAGMHLGLAAFFCRKYGRKLVFRVAHDSDCEPAALLIKYKRDKWLYEYGIRHADLILVQTTAQQRRLADNYKRDGVIAHMLVELPSETVKRDIDVLWVNNMRPFKRPEVFLEIAKSLPGFSFNMIGGVQPGHEALFFEVQHAARQIPNLKFHGPVSYHQISSFYSGARVFVNTSESEGFPNSFLQAWARGTPVISFFDPDSTITNYELGIAPVSLSNMIDAIQLVLNDTDAWYKFSANATRFVAERFCEDEIVAPYVDHFEELLR